MPNPKRSVHVRSAQWTSDRLTARRCSARAAKRNCVRTGVLRCRSTRGCFIALAAGDPRFPVYRTSIGESARTTRSIQARSASVAVNQAYSPASTCQSCSSSRRGPYRDHHQKTERTYLTRHTHTSCTQGLADATILKPTRFYQERVRFRAPSCQEPY